MRRVLGAIFIGLGGFLLVVAALSRFYLPGQVVKFPLNEYSITHLSGTNVSYFSKALVKEVTGASVEASSTTQGDVKSGSSSTAVWTNNLGITDVTSGTGQQPFSYGGSPERLAFNRRTGQLVNCCAASIAKKPEKFSGLGYVWPIGVQKQTYQVYDDTLLKPVPAVYVGTVKVDGFTTYEFIENIDQQQFGTQSVPGSLVQMPGQAQVTLPEYLTARNVYYVDPATGAPIKISEDQTQSLVDPQTGGTALTLFKGTLTSTPQSVSQAIANARPLDNKILWVEDLLPLLGLIVGVLLLIAGLLLLVSSERQGYEWEYDEQQVPAGA